MPKFKSIDSITKQENILILNKDEIKCSRSSDLINYS